MSGSGARAVLAVAVVAAVLGPAFLDLGRLSGGRFWSDASTYHAMAWSLAEDHDLRYEARDLLRVRREFPLGPQGILLKRATGGLALAGEFPWVRRVAEPRLYYAKAFAYPLAAAPFVRLLGTRGLLVVNGLALGLVLVLGYGELRRQAGPGGALAAVLVLFLGTVAPVYLLWMTPELFNLGLITGGLVAGRRGRPGLAALLLGVAAYSKPPNVFLALPLVLEPLLASGRGFGAGLAESLRRGLLVGGVALGLFGANALATGEWNYQGGERKAFEGRYPLETPDVTFDNAGTWMTTEHLGPLVKSRGNDAGDRSGAALTPAEIRGAFGSNLRYAVVGRFGGALPYFFPALLAALVFLVAGPRSPTGWLALASACVSVVFYVWLIPANWYGGGGAVGNRYFLNLLPLGLLFVPRGRESLVAGLGLLGAAAFLWSVLPSPLEASLRPGAHALREPFLHLPLELSELNDLSIFMEAWRKKRPVGNTEGGPSGRADPDAYYLYFPDDGTKGRETAFGGTGFWVRAGGKSEVVVRALEPVTRFDLAVHGGPAPSRLVVGQGASFLALDVAPGGEAAGRLEAAPGFPYYGTYLYVLRIRAEGAGAPADGAAFVRLALEVAPRP